MWAKTFNPCETAPELPGEPDLVFIFGTTGILRGSGLMGELNSRYPTAIQLGCSTGSAVDGVTIDEEGIRVLAVGFANTRVAIHRQALPDPGSSRQAGRALAASLAAPDLAGIFLLSIGLEVNGSSLVEGVQDILGADAMISGGLAGDGDRFGETVVTINGEVTEGTVAALALYGDAIHIAHGCFGGWDEFGPKRMITASQGSTLHALDGKPALDLYETYLGPEAENLPASGLLYPLNIWDPANPQVQFVRTLLSIDRESRSLILAGDVPQGWRAQLMRGTIDNLVRGAEQAARQAKDVMTAQGIEPQLCLFVSCVGRRLLMGQRTEEEIEAVSDVIGGDVPISGFYSYGEIAPQDSQSSAGLHNQTVTLTLLAEAV